MYCTVMSCPALCCVPHLFLTALVSWLCIILLYCHWNTVKWIIPVHCLDNWRHCSTVNIRVHYMVSSMSLYSSAFSPLLSSPHYTTTTDPSSSSLSRQLLLFSIYLARFLHVQKLKRFCCGQALYCKYGWQNQYSWIASVNCLDRICDWLM